ncbi:MAG TPA: haloacid dehalogenase-like hydrolase [Acidimicrobiales bacterium]|nr:haloacid dehalogenase-like hydrolase [Acidimicrobiales bacterium]
MPGPHRRLILWDIDGTLVHSGTVAIEIFERAFERVVGRPPTTPFSFAGKTDRQITEEFLVLAESPDPSHAEAILDLVEVELSIHAKRIAADGSMCVGAREAIEALSKVPGVAQTVLTGNIPANAKLKLAAFGLADLLDLDAGAYGREHSTRTALLPLAWQSQIDRYGRAFAADETWVVGDTPLDFDCARAGGAHCLLVGTGRFSATELEGVGADAVLPDLSDTRIVVEILTT